MKRLMWLYTLLILVGCTEDLSLVGTYSGNEEFYAVIENDDADSRTYIDDQIRMRWTAEDCITLFKKTTYNREYMFTGKTGSNAGGFRQVSIDDEFWYGVDVPYNYAIYPHSTDTELDEFGYFKFTMPAEQTYAENTFGLGTNTMVAVSESGQLSFKNVGSYLRVRLYGESVSVSSITLTSKGGEAIAGEAKITPTMGGNPTCEMIGNGQSVRLVCPTPVTISSDANNPTDFWIVVPPVTFSKGFSVTVENSDGDTQVFDVDKSVTFKRNSYNNLAREVTIEKGIPNTQIWYTSQTGNVVLPYELNFGDAKIISNEYIDGKGIMTFDGDINTIGRCTFYYKSDLLSITLPESLTSIGERAFEGCKNITKINMSNDITSIESYAFSGCEKLEVINIPNKIDKIKEGLFKGCKSLKVIEIPDQVTIIGDYAFADCPLETIEIPFGVTSLGGYAFSGNKFTSIEIPTSVLSIGGGTFYGSKFEEITIPNSVTSIGVGAFQFCKELTSIVLSKNISSLKDYTFYGCEKLELITIPDKVTSLGDGVFQSCSHLVSITLPNSVKKIGEGIFEGCTSLSSVFLSNKLTSISKRAFYNCTNLSTIDIPQSITSIGVYAFGYCTSLGSVTIPGNVVAIESSAYYGCTNLSSVTMNDGTETIGDHAFRECKKIGAITLPNSIISIGNCAFMDCSSMKTFTIPNNVKTIGHSAFASCVISEMICKASIPPTCGGTFDQTMLQTCILYVPMGLTNTYKYSYAWSDFQYVYEK